jgi:hypothetical protein
LAYFPTTAIIEDYAILQLLPQHLQKFETIFKPYISNMKVATFLALIPAAFAVINNEASSH